MSNAFFNVPIAINEPVKNYSKGSTELSEVLDEYNNMYSKHIDIPMYIGEKKIYTNNKRKLSPPHDHNHVVGTSNYGDKNMFKMRLRQL